ncbi:hypothetical protein LJC60_00270 [Ruminococcaceae bacterium OttesenSCG-928-D13]|nr:hypothetical protein [Ruminococcaceae bacterium OttesenSCG-928-D13]
MEDVRRLVRSHLTKYPGMEVDDCLKLLYQGELGGGHLIEDEAAFAARLSEELATPGLFTAAPPVPEPVGEGLCRVHLSALESGPGVPVLARLCALSAARAKGQGSPERLAEKLRAFAAMDDGSLPWPQDTARRRVEAYLAEGCPALHHSERYRRLYAPHYRLMDAGQALFLSVFAAVDRAMARRPHVLVGIDGMCASGKSTLADLLARVYGCGVVRADDFFLQPHQRSPERLAAPGGNIDYERLAPVARQAAEDRPFRYQTYDCGEGRLGDWRDIPAGPLTLLEGAYCLHPQVAAPCDLRVFLWQDADCQMARLRRRSPDLAERFRQEWIPMENRYFAAFGIREGCDLVLDTTGLG